MDASFFIAHARNQNNGYEWDEHWTFRASHTIYTETKQQFFHFGISAIRDIVVCVKAVI